MKKWLAILLAACLLLCTAALGEASPTEAPAEEAATAAPEETPEAEPTAAPEGAEEDAAEEAPADVDTTEAEGESDTEEPEAPVELWFEEGFGLTFPAGWVRYAVSEADRAAGIRYALGDGSGEHFLYVQMQSTRLDGIEALSGLIGQTEGIEKTGDLTFGEAPFVAFIDDAQNASGCATLWGGEIVTFLFTPQDDSAYMMAATEIMESFRTL